MRNINIWVVLFLQSALPRSGLCSLPDVRKCFERLRDHLSVRFLAHRPPAGDGRSLTVCIVLQEGIPACPVVAVYYTECLDAGAAKVSTQGGTVVSTCALAVITRLAIGRRYLVWNSIVFGSVVYFCMGAQMMGLHNTCMLYKTCERSSK